MPSARLPSTDMPAARRATSADARELVRLKQVMHDAMHPRPPAAEGTDWHPAAEEALRKRLADPDGTLAAFVVDGPEGLAACVVGVMEHRIAGPSNPTGESGYVFCVATDPGHRRRGCSRVCMEALLGWYRERGITRIDLRATAEAEPLYASLGFVRTPDPAMRLAVPAPR